MKQVIIVCDEKRKKFGDYLAQLISLEDDTDESPVGIKDGTVQAQVWLEKQLYNVNAETISSEQHIIFIGNSKELKSRRSFMKTVFSKYGIKYGSLGKQAFLKVENVVAYEEYNDFYEFAQKYNEDVKKAVNMKRPLKKSEKVGVVLGGIATTILAPLSVVGSTSIALGVVKLKKDNEIKEQMYECAVKKFYLDYLSEFLGL